MKSANRLLSPLRVIKPMRETITALCFLLLLTGCDQPKDTGLLNIPSSPLPLSLDVTGRQLHQQLNQLAQSRYELAASEADQLQKVLDSFLANPDPFTLADARTQWLVAYQAFLPTLFFGYLPITDPQGWIKDEIDYPRLLAQVDSWPIEGGYIDYLPDYPHSGIVNDVTLEISPDTLLHQHQFAAPESVSIGFHAIEFLLWGDDGMRPASDYLLNPEGASESDESTNAHLQHGQNPDRRRLYLSTAADMLTNTLKRMAGRWQPINGYYASLVDNSVADQVFMAGLSASRDLIDSDRLSALVNPGEDVGSHTNSENLLATLEGMEIWLLGAKTEEALQEGAAQSSDPTSPGALDIALQNQHPDLLERWKQGFSDLTVAIESSSESPEQSAELTTESELAAGAEADQNKAVVNNSQGDEAEAAATSVTTATSVAGAIKQLHQLLDDTASLATPRVTLTE